MTRETSKDVAAIAAKWLGMDDFQMQAFINTRMNAGDTTVLEEIRAMAGSCLGQAEPHVVGVDLGSDHLPWTDLVSSNLKRMRFNPATARLEVEFLSGAAGHYEDVRADVAAQLAIAKSPGKFLNESIKGIFRWTDTRKSDPPASTGAERRSSGHSKDE